MEIISLGLWIAGLFGKSPPAKIAYRLGLVAVILAGVIVLALAAWWGIAQYKAGIIEQHETNETVRDARKTLEADRAANAALATHAAETEEENRQLEEALAEAKREDPEKGQREVGPVVKSYFDNLPKKGK